MRPNEIKTERRLVDTMSETSETTTTTTTTTTSGKSGIDNRQELSDIAALLGIENIDDVHQERFRIDRKKLELMLLGDINAGEKAETFFQKVMEATNTYVTWPSRLKIGAKSKKDPHIKVAGRLDDIRLAKEKIIQILDTRQQNNRVTMKLDVSYTDHSHIIGKGGLTIKKVMEETGCHIHFPDSNRSNHQEKSNQVSIAGDMEGVEKARARVRKLTPLIFSFELPVMGNNSHLPGHSSPFSTSPYVVKIQEQYNVQVMFRTRPKLHATLVVVKGCEWEVSQVKEATVLLIHYMCENLASQIQVQMSMEISPQHHSIVLGKQSNNLKNIMQRTGTQIMFPDAGDPNIPSLKKSNVTITGSIFNVYLARQQLMGSLPLVLMFDLPEENMSSVNTENISRLMQSLDIFINVRHKPKQSTLSIVIKGIERNATNIYEARKQLLGLTEPIIIADIPPTYHIPNTNNFNNQNSCPSFGPIGLNENSINNRINISAPINITTPTSYCNLSPTPGAFSTNSSSMSYPPQWAITQLPPSLFSPISMNPNHLNAGFNYSSHLNQLLTAQQQQQQIFHNSNKSFGSSGNIQSNSNSLNSTLNSSILSSMRSGAYDSKDSAYSSISSATSSLSSPAMSPRNASPIDPSSTTEGNSNLDLSNVLSDFAHNNIVRSTSMDKKSRPELSYSLQDFNTMTLEYEQKKLLAMKAMQTKPNANDYRVPTTAWSGYGFSHTLPTIPNINDSQMQNPLTQTPDLWKESSVSASLNKPDYGVTSSKDESSNAKIRGLASNYLENQSNIQMRKITSLHHADLESMLTSVGLEKYIRLFTSHEVDMATFPSLTEKDLCEIGISAWGARRKIMLLISEMNKRTSAFSGSAAPGAERKNSLYNTGTSAAAATSTSSPPPRKSSLESSW